MLLTSGKQEKTTIRKSKVKLKQPEPKCVMPKPFAEAFKEWVADDRYTIGKDVGEEFFDKYESGPTPEDCSLTVEDNGTKTTTKKVLDCGTPS